MKQFTLLTMVMAITLMTTTASAQLSLAQPISYQGFLVADTGAVTGSYQIQFSIWDDSTAGTQLWTETHPSVPVNSGLFSLMLGSIVAIPVDSFIPADSFMPVLPNLYLEVQIGADPPITPRTQLGSVPTAGIAQRVAGDIYTGPGQLYVFWEEDAHRTSVNLFVDSGGPSLIMRDTTPEKVGEISYVPDTAGASINLLWGDLDRQVTASLGVDSAGGSLTIGDSTRTDVILNSNGLAFFTDNTNLKSRAMNQYVIFRDTFGDTLAYVSASGVYTSGPVRSGNSLVLNGPADQLETTSGEMYLGREEGTGAFSDVAVSIGHKTPAEMLDVAGSVKMDGFKLPTGATNGYVLTSDASGSGTWQAASGGGGNDNDWYLGTTNNDVLFTFGRWGIAGEGNTLHGSGDSTHVNLGRDNTTGTSGMDYTYITISGGWQNLAFGGTSSIGGGVGNQVSFHGGTIAGGNANHTTGTYGTVSGGQINSAGSYGSVGGGENNAADGGKATVAGGQRNGALGSWSTVGGGLDDTASGLYATVAGGFRNKASGDSSAVGGGALNIASGDLTVVGGGSDNNAFARISTIGGGAGNQVFTSSLGGTVGGGNSNDVTDTYGTVSGGQLNSAGSYSSVGGGLSDTASGPYATVSGGQTNKASNTHATVGGGEGNVASAAISTIGGGWMNEASAHGATVAGGDSCIASGNRSAIGGGLDNATSGWTSTVGGGSHNRARGDYSVVGGGGGPNKADSNLAGGTQSTVAGGIGNKAANGWTAIGGGTRNTTSGPASTISGGWENIASGQNGTIGGGAVNSVEGFGSTVGGGGENRAIGYQSTIAGGERDTAWGDWSSIGGGQYNVAYGQWATISGGYSNLTSLDAATIGGGYDNRADSFYTVVAGGYKNRALRTYASVGGGDRDSALGFYSTVPGGSLNRAWGDYSFAAGRRAKADHSGSFVWGDATNANFVSTGSNQFLIRASGGVGIGTNNPSQALHVVGNICATGSIGACSDRRFKKNIETTTGALGKVMNLRGVDFDWRTDEFPELGFDESRQIGFIAQEIKVVLPQVAMLGKDGYYSVDYAKLTPILVEAIKEQQKTIQDQKRKLSELRDETTSLVSQFAELNALVQALINERRGVEGSADLALKK